MSYSWLISEGGQSSHAYVAPSKSFTVSLSLTLVKAGAPVPRVGKTATAAQTAVSVPDCCVTKYHKCSVLKQHPFIRP